MKTFLAGVCLYAFCSIALSKSVTYKCPTPAITECPCYEAIGLMVCSALAKHPVIKNSVALKLLVIKDSPLFPLLTSDIGVNVFTTESLVIKQSTPINSEGSGGIWMNIMKTVALATESIEIEGFTGLQIDFKEVQPTVTSFSIKHATVKNLVDLLPNFQTLVNLELISVTLDKELELTQLGTSLNRLVINDCEQLTGKAVINYPNRECKLPTNDNPFPNPIIHIDLSNNKKLNDFDFGQLKGSKCRFYIDLSSNSGLNANFLTSKYAQLKDISANTFYLVLRNQELECDQCTFKYFNDKRKEYIHGVKCKTQAKFLDQITSLADMGGQACKT